MSDIALEHRKAQIKARLREYLADRSETGLTDVKRDLSNHFAGREELADNGLFVAKMLNAVGWSRDGFLHTGYDRTQRYAPCGSAMAD